MAAGSAATLAEDEIQVILATCNHKRLVVELDAVHHFGIGNGHTGPVAALLVVVAVPAIISYPGPVVGSHSRVLEEHGNLVGIIHLVHNGIVARDHALHGAVDQQTGLERQAMVDSDV